MAYGLKFDGVNGQTIFDTDKPLEFLTINGGTVTAAGTSTSFEADTDILFCRPASGSSFACTTTYPSGWPSGNNQTISVSFSQSTSFFKVRRTSVASNIGTPTGQYGLVIYDGTGTNSNDIIFSTIKTENAINILGTAEAGRVSGSGANAQALGTWNGSTVYSGSTTDVFVSVVFGNDAHSTSGTIQGFTFNSNSIVFNSTMPSFSGAGNNVPLPLIGQVVLAKVEG